MELVYTEDKLFEKEDFTLKALPKGEYEGCEFKNCNFLNYNLSAYKFIDCLFVNCNISMAALGNTVFAGANFRQCKMLGVQFNNCNEFGFTVSFDGCLLDNASFYKLKLKKTTFKNCSLVNVDFAECDLTAASFENSNLQDAMFDNTIIEKADFTTAYNYTIDLAMNRIKKARFCKDGLAGLLSKYDIVIE